MTEWQNDQPVLTGRAEAVSRLVTSLDENDTAYLAEKIEREEWLARAKEINNKLAVAGLQLVSRPWQTGPGK